MNRNAARFIGMFKAVLITEWVMHTGSIISLGQHRSRRLALWRGCYNHLGFSNFSSGSRSIRDVACEWLSDLWVLEEEKCWEIAVVPVLQWLLLTLTSGFIPRSTSPRLRIGLSNFSPVEFLEARQNWLSHKNLHCLHTRVLCSVNETCFLLDFPWKKRHFKLREKMFVLGFLVKFGGGLVVSREC